MRLDGVCEPVFARHETFHPRYGWVKKAVDAAANPRVFNEDSAVVELGVGKNMVRAIRHWGLALRVLTPMKEPGSRKPLVVPSAIGRALFADDGWDPYCELPGTQWLLHWWLNAPGTTSSPGSLAPVWWLTFNEFPGVEFNAEQLEQFVADRTRDWADPHPSAISKDVSCLLRMYATGQGKRSTFDDTIDCPFRDLDLLRPGSEMGIYRFSIGPKPTLPAAVAAFACLDFLARNGDGAKTVMISRLATEPGSPGRVFKLTETALIELLSEAAKPSDYLTVTTANGVPQLVVHDLQDDDEDQNVAGEDYAVAATDMLWDHYRGLSGPDAFKPMKLLVSGQRGDLPARRSEELEPVGTK